MTRISAAFLVLATLASSSACGQKRVATTFKDLEARVRPGTTMYVTASDGTQTKGQLEELSGGSLKLRVRDATLRDFSEGGVERITIKDPLWNGLLIGAAIGGLAFAAVGEEGCVAPYAVPGCRKVSRGEGIATMAAIGAGIGIGFDVLHRQRVYRGSSTRGASLTILPVVGRGRTGVMLASRF